jgi:two-component system, NtrC family, nitrogen regulation sensor histidine kinase NtrY
MTSVDQAVSSDLALGKPVGRLGFRILGPLGVGFAMLSAIVTFVVLAGLTPLPPTHDVVVTLLGINVLTVFFIIAVIGLEVFRIMQARRHGRAAARLHIRIVGLFSVIAAVPAVLLAVVATVTLERGLDQLFTGQTRALI